MVLRIRKLLPTIALCLPLAVMASEPLALLQEPSEDAKAMLQPWVDEFRASMVGPDQFEEYRLVLVDESTLDAIRHGRVKQVAFNYSDSMTYSMTISEVREKDTNWYFSAKADSNENSLLVFSVFPDGAISGNFHFTGLGAFIVTTTNVLPYRLIHMATGTYTFD